MPTLPGISDCSVFPADNVWNARIDHLDVASNSATMISAIGLNAGLHMDFGSYAGYGIPYNVVTSATPTSTVTFDYDEDSDHVPYPIPASPKIEGGGTAGAGDRHILMVDADTCRLYELFNARKVNGAWRAGSGATWDMHSNALRTAGWTSADAAGLPILPGLVRYDEVARRGHQPRPPVHDRRDPQAVHLPGAPLRQRLDLGVAAADGPARPPRSPPTTRPASRPRPGSSPRRSSSTA